MLLDKTKQQLQVGKYYRACKQLGNPQECVNSTQKPKLLKKSVEGLTSNVKDCLPYWNEQCKVNSSHLWLPTETDWLGSVSTLSSSSYGTPVAKSWFSTSQLVHQNENSQKTYLRYCTTFHAECTEAGHVNKTKKVRIYPTKEQKHLFKKWFGVSRLVQQQHCGVVEPANEAETLDGCS